MVLARFIWLWLAAVAMAIPAPAAAVEKSDYLDMARRGWNYQLRIANRQDMTIPVHIHGRDLSGAAICVVGERPHPQTRAVINAFRTLVQHSFGKPLPMRFAGAHAWACGTGRVVVLRLYSGHPPNRDLSADLHWMNRTYDLRLPRGREYAATSPAMAQTFFGHRGQGTHIMVKQPALAHLGELEKAFYTSILLEELFQSFTFGMDVLQFDRAAPFLSKLQETPLNLHRLSWNSRGFMRALLRSNPGRLCAFDVFMLHAVAQSPVDQTIEPRFIDYIDTNFDALRRQTMATLADPRFAGIVDGACQRRD